VSLTQNDPRSNAPAVNESRLPSDCALADFK
ncbi:uncharacterized protein METZ01_LOCUS189759, partial [marine metagenome]